MDWNSQIGFDKTIMNKVDDNNFKRQKFIYSAIEIMLLTISILVFISSVVYSTIIFNNWFISITSSIFLSLVIFNIYRFLIITSINAQNSTIGEYLINHENHYYDFKFLTDRNEIYNMNEEQIKNIVYNRKNNLRLKFKEDNSNNYKMTASSLSFIIRIVIIIVIALLFSTGIELFIFQKSINFTLNEIVEKLKVQDPDSWMLNNILLPENGKQFIFFKSSSLLMVIEILESGLRNFKVVLDLILLLIFIMPLILISKSKEIKNGEYVKELALHEISISFYHFLISQKQCQSILDNLKKKKIMKMK